MFRVTINEAKNPFQGITSVDEVNEELHGKWCKISYDGRAFPGIIQDTADNETEVKVSHQIGDNRLFWPALMDDILWYSLDNAVTLILPPTPAIKRRHQVDKVMWKAVSEKLNL